MRLTGDNPTVFPDRKHMSALVKSRHANATQNSTQAYPKTAPNTRLAAAAKTSREVRQPLNFGAVCGAMKSYVMVPLAALTLDGQVPRWNRVFRNADSALPSILPMYILSRWFESRFRILRVTIRNETGAVTSGGVSFESV